MFANYNQKMYSFYVLLKHFLDPVVLILLLMILCLFISKARRKRYFFILLFPIFLLYTMSISFVSNRLCYFLEKDYLASYGAEDAKVDVIAVLGGGVSENEYVGKTLLSSLSSLRLLHAIQLSRRNGARHLYLVGRGIGRISEAEAMCHVAERLGVPKEKIMIESLSRNTREHAIEMNKAFSDKNIHIGLVTSAYHMKRSEREFRKYFRNIIPLVSDYLYSTPEAPLAFSFIPNSGSLQKTAVALHEMMGLLWYRLKIS